MRSAISGSVSRLKAPGMSVLLLVGVYYLYYYTELLSVDSSTILPDTTYPKKPNRHWFGSQECYTKDEMALTKAIKELYKAVPGVAQEADEYFDLNIKKEWYDLWVCATPKHEAIQRQLEYKSFAVTSHDAKDGGVFPLASYADGKAIEIGNQQGRRLHNQRIPSLLNDPVMLVLEMLKDWFSNKLANAGCDAKWEKEIDDRVLFVKQLRERIPNFGDDRAYFNELQKSLKEAGELIVKCTANKLLPQHAANVISESTNYETYVARVLHHLVNQHAADSFAPQLLLHDDKRCHDSAVCTIHKAAEKLAKKEAKSDAKNEKAISVSAAKQVAAEEHADNKFYSVREQKTSGGVVSDIRIRMEAIDDIKFPSFFESEHKEKYLKIMASLEELSKTRRILESFQADLSNMGNIVFAMSYKSSLEILLINYGKLIEQTSKLLEELIIVADDGMDKTFSKLPAEQKVDEAFRNNFNRLESKIAEKGMTLKAQLAMSNKQLNERIEKYRVEMSKLAKLYASDPAREELAIRMSAISKKIEAMNKRMPTMIRAVGGNAADLLPQPVPGSAAKSSIAPPDASEAQSHQRRLLSLHEDEKMEDEPVFVPQMPVLQTSSAVRTSTSFIGSTLQWAKSGVMHGYQQLTGMFAPQEAKLPFMDEKGRSDRAAFSSEHPLAFPQVEPKPNFISEETSRIAHADVKRLEGTNAMESTCVRTGANLFLVGYGWYKVFQQIVAPEKVVFVTASQRVECKQHLEKINKLREVFVVQKQSKFAKSGIYQDKFDLIENRLRYLSSDLNEVLRTRKSTKKMLAEFGPGIERIEYEIHQIAKGNKQYRKCVVKNNRLQRRNQNAVLLVRRDTLTADLKSEVVKFRL